MDQTDCDANRAQGGDEESLIRLYERLAPALFAWSRFRLKSRSAPIEAEDLVQEVWFRALSGFGRFESRRPGSFRAWFFTIAANAYVELMRKRHRDPAAVQAVASEVPAEVTSITQALRKRETIASLVDKVDALGADERRLFIHYGLEGQTAAEVAEQLGVTENTVHKRWQRLRESLAADPAWRELVDDDS